MLSENHYLISGKVIKGKGYGRKIGFPTINIDRRHFLKLKKKPPLGIYYGFVEILEKKYKAGIIIGPKDKKGIPKVEAHLVGFAKNAYSQKAFFELRGFIRKFKKFKSEQELVSQIKKDMTLVAKQR